jgi:hypothetical protein
LLHHLHNGTVDDPEHELRIEAKREHQGDCGRESEAFAGGEVGERSPLWIERPGEDALKNAQDKESGDEESQD